LFSLIFCPLLVIAEEYSLPKYGYTVDIPEGWRVLKAADPRAISFTDSRGAAIFEVQTHDEETFLNVEDYFLKVKNKLSAGGEGAPFSYYGYSAILADLRFNTAGQQVRGYFVFLLKNGVGICLYAIAPEGYYQHYHDYLLSSIDSFSPHPSTGNLPGPISTFYYPFPGPEQKRERIGISLYGRKDVPVAFSVDPKGIEASSVVMEREARILSSYPAGDAHAWRRFFRIIYRDNYSRLEGLYRVLKDKMEASRGKDFSKYVPKDLLYWLQRFEYRRLGTTSDITPPLQSVLEASGDCDSRGLVYTILLHHFGFQSILLVSHIYGHAVAAVDMEGPGARYTYRGKTYLIAETTERVDIGLIAADMADPKGWIPVSLTNSP
jgi:hypothetical protein